MLNLAEEKIAWESSGKRLVGFLNFQVFFEVKTGHFSSERGENIRGRDICDII